MKKIKEMSKMRKLLLSMLTLVFGVMMFTVLQSNTFERGESLYTYGFTKNVQVSMLLPEETDITKFSNFNLKDLESYDYTKKFDYFLDNSRNLTITTEYLTSNNMLADWQTELPKSIVTDKEVKVLDKRGNVKKVIPHSEMAIDSHYALTDDLSSKKDLGSNSLFSMPNKDAIQELRAAGVTVTINKDGTYDFEDETMKQHVDPGNLTTSTTYYDDNKIEMFVSYAKYKEMNHVIRKDKVNTLKNITLSNGEKVIELTKEHFTNYYETINK